MPALPGTTFDEKAGEKFDLSAYHDAKTAVEEVEAEEPTPAYEAESQTLPSDPIRSGQHEQTETPTHTSTKKDCHLHGPSQTPLIDSFLQRADLRDNLLSISEALIALAGEQTCTRCASRALMASFDQLMRDVKTMKKAHRHSHRHSSSHGRGLGCDRRAAHDRTSDAEKGEDVDVNLAKALSGLELIKARKEEMKREREELRRVKEVQREEKKSLKAEMKLLNRDLKRDSKIARKQERWSRFFDHEDEKDVLKDDPLA